MTATLFKVFYIYIVPMCACMWMLACFSVHVEVRGQQLLGVVLSFKHVCSGNRTRIVRLGSKLLCQLSPLTSLLAISL